MILRGDTRIFFCKEQMWGSFQWIICWSTKTLEEEKCQGCKCIFILFHVALKADLERTLRKAAVVLLYVVCLTKMYQISHANIFFHLPSFSWRAPARWRTTPPRRGTLTSPSTRGGDFSSGWAFGLCNRAEKSYFWTDLQERWWLWISLFNMFLFFWLLLSGDQGCGDSVSKIQDQEGPWRKRQLFCSETTQGGEPWPSFHARTVSICTTVLSPKGQVYDVQLLALCEKKAKNKRAHAVNARAHAKGSLQKLVFK